jgi:hypothetical protein
MLPIVHVVGAGITTPILSPLPETTTCHSVLDLVKLEKRVPANHDSPHRWWPTNAPIISGAIGAKQYFCFDRLNTTRERNSPTLPYIEYATNYSISLKFITRNFDLI